MKKYDVVIEGEHISFEARQLKFGEFQKDCHNEKVDNCSDFDGGDFGKWFRLDKATVYVQEYNDNGVSEIISYLYKNGYAVDDGFVSETISDSQSESPICMRLAMRDCAAWGEFDDDKFDPKQLKIIKSQRDWSDGEKRECIIGFQYCGRDIVLMDETDAESYDYFLSLSGKMIKIAEDPDSIRSALDKVDEFNSSVYAKEYVEFKNDKGNIRGFYKLGFLVNDDGTSDVICVAPEERPCFNKKGDKPMYRCYRVQEWKVRYASSEIESDDKGKYIEFDPDSKDIAVIEKTEFFYSPKDDRAYEKSEHDKLVNPITLKHYDRNKAIVAIVGGRIDKDICLKMLCDLDSHNWIRKSNVSDECLTNIWIFDDAISESWKHRILKDLSDPRQNSPVLTIPFEYDVFAFGRRLGGLWKDEKKLIPSALMPEYLEGSEFSFEENHKLSTEHILWLLHKGRLSCLDELVLKGKLVKFSDQKWNEIALRINGEVEENGEANLSSALLWLDRYKPGLLAKAKDIYGNNMAMYTFAVMISRIKSMDECCAYEKALTMLKLLEKFGVDVCQANQFGISAQMVYGRDSESKKIVNPVLR